MSTIHILSTRNYVSQMTGNCNLRDFFLSGVLPTDDFNERFELEENYRIEFFFRTAVRQAWLDPMPDNMSNNQMLEQMLNQRITPLPMRALHYLLQILYEDEDEESDYQEEESDEELDFPIPQTNIARAA